MADVAGLELDKIKFQHPVRPGDRLSITIEYVERRESRKKPDRGIVTRVIEVRNQRGETVCKYRDTFLALKRPL